MKTAKHARLEKRVLTVEEQRAEGKTLRAKVPRASHASWKPPDGRADPVKMLRRSDAGRMEELLPIRYARMLESPFTFYRGAAAIMAADLARTPSTGIRVQSCGDCHLLNIGAFGTPERRLIIDINDFDETLPAPFEWDIKRLAASFVVAGRNNRLGEGKCRDAAEACVRSYRKHMDEFAEMHMLDVWYASHTIESVADLTDNKDLRQRAAANIRRASGKSAGDLHTPELIEEKNGRYRIKDAPPLIFHLREITDKRMREVVNASFALYRKSLSHDRRVLLDAYRLVDIAVKVVGVGSVGRRCFVLLLIGPKGAPLYLQVKEAVPSVLEPYAGASVFPNHGQRVVVGQRIMQAASDIFLGWTEGQKGRQFYIRQLREIKIKPIPELWDAPAMKYMAGVCGMVLARAHARSGFAARIAGYLGGKDTFDKAVSDFSVSYADQNERDHAALVKAVRAGRIHVST